MNVKEFNTSTTKPLNERIKTGFSNFVEKIKSGFKKTGEFLKRSWTNLKLRFNKLRGKEN